MKWGVPDWRDAGSYPAAEDLTLNEWWWEFTRRRPDYRSAWGKWSAFGTEAAGDIAFALTDDPDAIRAMFGVSVIYDPSCSVPDWDLRQMRFPSVGFAVGHTGGSRTSHGAYLAINDQENLEAEIARLEEERQKLQERGFVDYRFSLSEPLGPQIKKAVRDLENWQSEFFGTKSTRRHRRDYWPLYLRVIDARDERTPFARIQKNLWPGLDKTPQSARDTHYAACQLRDNFPI